MSEMADNFDRSKVIAEEVNRYIERVEKIPLYSINRYILIYYCLEYLELLGYKYDLNSRNELVIVNYYHIPDMNEVAPRIETLYRRIRTTVTDIPMFDTDRQNILFQFREIIFKSGVEATYLIGRDEIRFK